MKSDGRFVAVSVAAVLVCWPAGRVFGGSAAETFHETDALLQRTLRDLRARLEEAARQNRAIGAQNAALRKKVTDLRKTLRSMEDRRLAALEEGTGLLAAIKEGRTEAALQEGRRESLQGYVKDLQVREAILKTKIRDIDGEGEDLAGRRDAMQRRLQGLQRRLVSSMDGDSGWTARLARRRETIRTKERRREETALRLETLERRLSVLRDEDRLVTEAQMRIKQRFAGLREVRESLKQERRTLEQAEVQRQEEARRLEVRARAGIETLQRRREVLRTLVEEMRSSLGEVEGWIPDAARRLRVLREVLRSERISLERWDAALQEGAVLGRRPEASGVIAPSEGRPADRLARLRGTKKDLQTRIASVVKAQDSLRRREEALKRGAARWTRDAVEVRGTKGPQRGRGEERSLGSEGRLRRRLAVLEGKTKDLREALGRLKGEEDRRRKLRERLEGDLTDLRARREALEGPGRSSEAEMETSARAEIEMLEVRRDILRHSLRAIRERYRPEGFTPETFARDRDELREYLKVLQAENAGLQKRLESLRAALDRMKVRRALERDR